MKRPNDRTPWVRPSIACTAIKSGLVNLADALLLVDPDCASGQLLACAVSAAKQALDLEMGWSERAVDDHPSSGTSA